MERLNVALISEEEKKGTSIPFCALLLANGAIGAGILTLSLAVSKIGYGMGAFMYVFFGFFAGYANFMLYKVQRYTQQKTYSAVAGKMYGKKFEWFVDLVQLVYSFGACVGYAIVIADNLQVPIQSLLQPVLTQNMYFLFSREFVLIVVTLLVILPPSLMKKITALRFTSGLALIGILYVTTIMVKNALEIKPCDLAKTAAYACDKETCVIDPNSITAAFRSLASCIEGCQGGHCDDNKSNVHAFIFGMSVFTAMPVFCYSHCSQVQFIPIIADINKPNKYRVSLVILLAYVIIFFLYSINSLAGYLSFCGYSTGDILNSYSSNDIAMLVGRVIIGIAICFTFPLYGYSVREILCKLLGFTENTANWKTILVTVVYVLFSSFTALFLRSLYTIVSLTGAIGGSLIEAIIPAVLNLKYLNETHEKGEGSKRFLCWLFIVIGAVMAILGTATNFIS